MERTKVLIIGDGEKALALATFLISSIKSYELIFYRKIEEIDKIEERQIDVIVDLDIPERIMGNIEIYKKMGTPFMAEISNYDIFTKVTNEVSKSKINALIDTEFDIGSAFKKILDIKLKNISLPSEIEIEKDDKGYDKFSDGMISRESYIYKNIFFMEINWRKASKALWLKSVLLAMDFIKERKFHVGTIFQMKDIFEK